MTKLDITGNDDIAILKAQLRRYDFVLAEDLTSAETTINASIPTFSGWFPNSSSDSATPAYASATYSDPTLYYQVGDKIRLQQDSGAYSYFYVTAASSATSILTLTGGNDYSVASSPIIDFKVSRADSPFGFPSAFNYSPTITGFSVTPSGGTYRFYVKGRICTMMVYMPTPGTSNAVTFTVSLPIVASSSLGFQLQGTSVWGAIDNGAAPTNPARAHVNASATVATLDKDFNSAGGWTNVSGKSASFILSYEI